MTAKKAAPAKKAPATQKKADPDNTPTPEPKRGDKPDEAGSADPASESFARHPRPE